MAKTKDQADAAAETSIENAAAVETATEAQPEAETSIENAVVAQTANAETDGPQGENIRSADQPLDGPTPGAEGAAGADTTEGGADAEQPAEAGPTEEQRLEFLEVALNQIGKATANGTVPDDLRAHMDERGLIGTDPESGVVTVSIMGITAGSTFGLHRALLDWCMAASQEIMKGRAAA